MSNSDYHEHPAIGSTFIKDIAIYSLFHALKRKYKDATDPMILGSAVHCLLGTPEEFKSEFALELKKENFTNVVETVEDIKNRIGELSETQMKSLTSRLKKEQGQLAGITTKKKKEIALADQDLEKRIDNIDPSKFETKRAYNSKVNEIKKKVRFKKIAIKDRYATREKAYKEQIAETKSNIKRLRSSKVGNREKLITKLKTLDPTTNVWSELKQIYKDDNQGKYIISRELFDKAIEMKDSVLAHSMARSMIRGGESEYAHFAYDPITNLHMKCKPDIENQGLIDFKSTRDASREAFMRECLKRGYHIQAAWYLDVYNMANGTDFKDFFFIAIENTYPYAVNTLELGHREIELGRQQYREALQEYKEYLENKGSKSINDYGYGQQIERISYPDSIYRKRLSA